MWDSFASTIKSSADAAARAAGEASRAAQEAARHAGEQLREQQEKMQAEQERERAATSAAAAAETTALGAAGSSSEEVTIEFGTGAVEPAAVAAAVPEAAPPQPRGRTLPPPPQQQQQPQQQPQWVSGLLSNLHRAGDALAATSKNATDAIGDALKDSPSASASPRSGGNGAGDRQHEMVARVDAVASSISSAFGSAVGGIRSAIKDDAVAGRLLRGRAGTTAGVDRQALDDMGLVYLTSRLIACGHPGIPSESDGDLTGPRKLTALSRFLKGRHGEGRFMVWNLSEVEYDYSSLDDNVLTYRFPGHPSPPLGLLVKLLVSIESWLRSDPRNVAVIHCLTGRGRTGVVAAALLCWTGEAGFRDPASALAYVAGCRGCTADSLTIPSQRRYMQYFSNMVDGVRPNKPPLTLRRVIMSNPPKFGLQKEGDADGKGVGCAPYLQVFKSGELVFTTAAQGGEVNAKGEALPWVYPSDGPTAFPINLVIQGDILLRCRHLTAAGRRLSMFRAAFHTGYVPAGVLRLSLAQLDGACTDNRFDQGFFIDLIFEACESELAGQQLIGSRSGEESEGSDGADAAGDEEGEDAGVITASAYDSMLHKDDRFWDEIATKRRVVAALEDGEDEMSGPTIGRRFNLHRKKKKGGEADGSSSSPTKSGGGAFSIDPFGIGTEEAPQTVAGPPAPVTAPPKKADSLMEALLALDDDGDEADGADVMEDNEDVGVPSAATLSSEESLTVVQRDMMGTSLGADEAVSGEDKEAMVEGQVGGSSVLVEASTSATEAGGEDATPPASASAVLPDNVMEDHSFLDGGDGDDDDDDDDLGDLDDLENFLTRAKEASN
mmetsp:Transcript_32400/g.64206  ORF Transcript_32400/g.64206 Transcript_32400/m.64206 type:complete len:836 (-) Transcript_32400:189-2696(-)